MTTISPGTYVLTCDVANAAHNKRAKYDWRQAMAIIPKGTRFHVVRERWYQVEDTQRATRFSGEEIDEDGWIYHLVLTKEGERSMYDTSSRGGERSLWHAITPHLERVEDGIEDVLRLMYIDRCADGDDVLRYMVATGKLTVEEARLLMTQAADWRDSLPDD